jgi:VIT1/CCC1 family predicted Fe2+/Mn2+ transporter
MIETAKASLASKYLDPATSMGEVLFGLIMTLTFTLGAGLTIQEEGREGANQLLIATIGCNIAWGVIDGVFYVLGQLFERGRKRRVVQLVRRLRNDNNALLLVAEELDDIIEKVTTPEERRGLYARIVQYVQAAEMPRNRVTRDDWMGAVASFVLVFFSSLPAALPFVFIDDAMVALRVSNSILLGLLFWVGFSFARYTTSRPVLTGLAFLLFGAALVGLAIALGG